MVKALVERAVDAARTLTRNGEAIDDHQVVVERIAYVATQARVIDALADVPPALRAAAEVARAELEAEIVYRLGPINGLLSLAPELSPPGPTPAHVEAIGAFALEHAGRIAWPLDETLDEIRANVRAFAEREVA